MEILSAIVQLLGGLALFLYGIELMGDGLKNSSGAALKRVLEKVTGNVVMGVLTGALVTAGALVITLEHQRVKRVERRWLSEHPDATPNLHAG